MSMIIRRTSYPNPDSAGLAPILPSQDEMDLHDSPYLLHWFEAGAGVDALGVRCKKTGVLMGKARTLLPPVQRIPAYRNQPSFLFSSIEMELGDLGQQLFPLGEYAMLMVGRPGPNQNAFPMGAATPGSTQTTRFQCSGQDAGSGATTVRTNDGGTTGTSATIAVSQKYADGPALMIGSQRPQAVGDPGSSTAIYRMMLSTGAITSAETDTAESPLGNVHRNLHVGGVTSAAASSGGLIGGDISMWMIFNRALHLDLPLRDLAIRVVRARYAIPVAA